MRGGFVFLESLFSDEGFPGGEGGCVAEGGLRASAAGTVEFFGRP